VTVTWVLRCCGCGLRAMGVGDRPPAGLQEDGRFMCGQCTVDLDLMAGFDLDCSLGIGDLDPGVDLDSG